MHRRRPDERTVLDIPGGKDLQVPAADLAGIRKLVPAPVDTHEISDLSHILRSQPGPATLSGYKKEARLPLDARVTDLVVRWVAEHGSGSEPDPVTRPRRVW